MNLIEETEHGIFPDDPIFGRFRLIFLAVILNMPSILFSESAGDLTQKAGRTFSQEEIEKAVVKYESIVFMEILSHEAAYPGTRSYQTIYNIKVNASTMKWAEALKDVRHWGQPRLKGKHYLAIIPPEGVLRRYEELTIPVSEKDGMELFNAYKTHVDLIKKQILPDEALREVKKGKMDLLLVKPGMGVEQETGFFSKVQTTLYTLNFIKDVTGNKAGPAKVRLLGSHPLKAGGIYLLAVATSTDKPQKTAALEVTPETMDKAASLNKARVNALAERSTAFYADPEGD